MSWNTASKMKQSVLVFLASSVVALATCVEAHAGHYEWQFQGIYSGWVYVPDDSDNSAYTWQGESSGPSSQPPRRTEDGQPLGRTARPIVTQQQIQTEQAARIRYNQAQLNQGKTSFKPTLLSTYRRP